MQKNKAINTITIANSFTVMQQLCLFYCDPCGICYPELLRLQDNEEREEGDAMNVMMRYLKESTALATAAQYLSQEFNRYYRMHMCTRASLNTYG